MSFRVNLARFLARSRRFCTVGLQRVNEGQFDGGTGRKVETQTVETFLPFRNQIETNFNQERVDFKEKLKLCEKVSEVCELFGDTRNKLGSSELLMLLSRIIQINQITVGKKSMDFEENIEFFDDLDGKRDNENENYFDNNEYCLISLNKQRSVNLKKLDKRVPEIFIDLINKFSSLNTEQILYLNRMCECLKGYHRKVVLSFSEDRIGPSLSQIEPEDLIRTGLVLGSRSENVDFVKIYITELFKKIHLFDKEQKILLFQTMSKSKKCSSIFLRNFANHITGVNRHNLSELGPNGQKGDQKEQEFTDTDYIKFLSVYSNNPKCISGYLFKYLMAKCLVSDLSQLNLTSVLDLVWISSKLNNVDMFLPKAVEYLSQRIQEVGPNSLTMLIWSYSNSKMRDVRFQELLEESAVKLSQEMTPKNLSLCAYGLSQKKGSKHKFLNHIQDDIVSNISHFNGLDLAMLASAYSRALCGSSVLHQCIQESAMNYVEDLPADCISKLLYSYAMISGKTSLFSSFMFHFLERIHQFPVHEFIQVLWSYLVMRFYEVSFWNTCLEVVFSRFNLIIEDSRCYLLYSVLKTLTQLNVVPNTPDSSRLMNHTRKYFWESQQRTNNNNNNKNSELVAKVLKSVTEFEFENVSFNHNEEYFLVDVVFTYLGNKYAVFIYNNFNTFNKTPTGDLKLKELFLTSKGFKMVRILEELWINMDQNQQIQVIKSQL